MSKFISSVGRTLQNVFKNRSFSSRCFSTVEKEEKWETRIFSGVQPTGAIHIGNYFGAIEKWVALQDEGNRTIYSIVDLHSITLPQDPMELRANILLMTATLIACGIDPKKSIIFQQSKVHQHTELFWVLSSLSTMARLSHLPQYKEKSADLKDVPLGLFIYPVLQAADILLYRSTHVPVGEDQEQHMQIAQTLARQFNNRFGVTFPIPQTIMASDERNRVRSLREPQRKMSKSHADAKSRIQLTDTPEVIVEKVKKAVTDHTSTVTYEPEKRPAVSNLVLLHSLASGRTCEEICSEASGIDTGRYKQEVSDALIARLKPIREEIERLQHSPDFLQETLERGAERASFYAELTWRDVIDKVGLDIKHLPQLAKEMLRDSNKTPS
ncbi:tryptophan--tRNA ligase, mitochondrial [Nilaparvata lugens]|uniref:tryptophan--tRNA ligase, mitochondrial n=1 Tax=Nilaparvata lugens TaxID=108931 RepID=UPI00193DCFA4|nr:tryptophan--tRNA ligase, mitochondrial [Nilaparvata lugens]